MNRRTLRAKAFADKTIPVIVQLMDEFLTNQQIADSLNEQHHYTPRGLKWSVTSVSSFVHKHQIKPSEV